MVLMVIDELLLKVLNEKVIKVNFFGTSYNSLKMFLNKT